MAFAWVLLAAGASVVAARSIENRVGDDAAAELAAAGLGGAVGVEMDGQTARINTANPAAADRAVVVLEQVAGVQTVSFDSSVAVPNAARELDIDEEDLPDRSDLAAVLAGGDGGASETEADDTSSDGDTTTTTTDEPVGTTTTADLNPYAESSSDTDQTTEPDRSFVRSTTTTTERESKTDESTTTSTTEADQQRTVSAIIGDGQVELAGRLRSTRDQGTLLDTIASGTPEPGVTNGIRLMRRVETGNSRSLLAFAILTNRLATSFSVASAQLIGDDITLSGKVRSSDSMADIDSIIRTARDTGVAISTSLTVADGGPVTVDSRPILQQDLDRIASRSPIAFIGSTTELTPAGRSAVAASASAIRRNPGWDVEIQAHTKTKGIETENYTLSRLRAETVQALLLEAGIDEDLLTFRGFGSTVPGPIGTDGKRLDDRVEFAIKEHVETVVIDEDADEDDEETE